MSFHAAPAQLYDCIAARPALLDQSRSKPGVSASRPCGTGWDARIRRQARPLDGLPAATLLCPPLPELPARRLQALPVHMVTAPAPLQHRVAAFGAAWAGPRVREVPVQPLVLCKVPVALFSRQPVQPVEVVPGGAVVVGLSTLLGAVMVSLRWCLHHAISHLSVTLSAHSRDGHQKTWMRYSCAHEIYDPAALAAPIFV